MLTPEDLLYSKTHEWLRIEDNVAVIGITEFAQDALGDITYIELPEVGDVIASGTELGAIESVKAASELYSPVNGEIIAVNEALTDNPELVNSSPYEEGWIVKIKLSGAPEGLLKAADYNGLCAEDH